MHPSQAFLGHTATERASLLLARRTCGFERAVVARAGAGTRAPQPVCCMRPVNAQVLACWTDINIPRGIVGALVRTEALKK